MKPPLYTFFLVLVGLILVVGYLVIKQKPCSEGGIMGNICDCAGLKIPLVSKESGYADGFADYKCVGLWSFSR